MFTLLQQIIKAAKINIKGVKISYILIHLKPRNLTNTFIISRFYTVFMEKAFEARYKAGFYLYIFHKTSASEHQYAVPILFMGGELVYGGYKSCLLSWGDVNHRLVKVTGEKHSSSDGNLEQARAETNNQHGKWFHSYVLLKSRSITTILNQLLLELTTHLHKWQE